MIKKGIERRGCGQLSGGVGVWSWLNLKTLCAKGRRFKSPRYLVWKENSRWFKDPLPQYCSPNHLIPMTMTMSSIRLAAQANQKHFYSRSFRNSHLKLVTSKVLAHDKWQRTRTNAYVVTKVKEKKTYGATCICRNFQTSFQKLKDEHLLPH
jgi:hypothetical protein